MPDYAGLRRAMVDGQVRTNDVTDLRMVAAMLDLPRERFVPSDRAPLAYLDRDVPVNASRRPQRLLLKPMVLAKLLQAADIRETDRVLDVGCATGYSSALIGRLAASVVAVEEDSELARLARDTLSELGAGNVSVEVAPLRSGFPASAPYDVIVLEGATEIVPQQLLDQLTDGGRLVCVLRSGPAGKAMLFRRLNGEPAGRAIFDAAAPVLPGFGRAAEFVF